MTFKRELKCIPFSLRKLKVFLILNLYNVNDLPENSVLID